MSRKMVLFAGVLFLLCIPGLLWAGDMKLKRAVICLDIKDKEPVGEGKEFDAASVKKVFCLTEVEGGSANDQITHVWYFGGKKVHEFSVPVKAATWRTWTSKTIFAGQTGAWKVDVMDSSGKKIVGSAEFKIK
jgi:hypothetical protein